MSQANLSKVFLKRQPKNLPYSTWQTLLLPRKDQGDFAEGKPGPETEDASYRIGQQHPTTDKQMNYRKLGNTGIDVSEIGFGCGDVGGLMVKG